MRSQRYIPLALTLLCALQAWSSHSSTPSSKVDADVRRYMEAMHDLRHFSGVVVIARNGKVLSAHSYGYADFDRKTPNTLRTRFRIGSMTKQFTAMAIMQLRDAGKVTLDDSICKYFESCPDGWKPVKLRHLLDHSSGIPNYTSFPELTHWKEVGATPDEIISVIKSKPLDFSPGEKMAYSNSGYVLLGRLIEKVSRQGYAEFLRNHIFTPLAMNDSGYEGHTPNTNHAQGYMLADHELRPAEHLDMSVPYSAGALYSTAEDLMRWDAALYTDKLLGQTSRDEMFTPGKGDAAFGWFALTDKYGRKMLVHDGGINGFASFIARYPETKTLLIILSNLQNTNVDAVDKNLAAIAFNEPFELPKPHTTVAVRPEVLKDYAGEYRLPWGSTLLVTANHERLYVGGNGRPKVELQCESDSQFYLEQSDVEIRFVRDQDGKVTEALFGEFKAPRVK